MIKNRKTLILFKCIQNICQDIVGHKTNLDEFLRIKTMQSMTSNYSRMASEINNKETVGNPKRSEFSNLLTNSLGVKGGLSREVKNVSLSNRANTEGCTKACLRDMRLLAPSASIRKEARSESNDLSIHFVQLKKKKKKK